MMAVPTQRSEMLCILYCDIIGSTGKARVARMMGQEEAYNAQLDTFRTLWREALNANGGRHGKWRGDGWLATFADPLEGIRAVVEAREAMRVSGLLKTFPVRLGLHVGTVSLRSDAELQGADVSLGERVMSAAQPDQILVSGAFAEAIQTYLPNEYGLHELGQWPLKGFERPIRLCGLSAPGFPTGSATLAPNLRWQGNLPPPLDRFIGRKRELKELQTYFRRSRPSERCLTLVGAPGSGKTRLAQELGRKLQQRFAEGVCFIPLEEVTDAEGVLPRIALPFALPLGQNSDLLYSLQRELAERTILLILDNFEQVGSAADVLLELLHRLPSLHLLVTSREPLGLRGERLYDLQPLELPEQTTSARVIAAADSVQLFVERAQRVNRAFQLTEENARGVANICQAVAGLPLAIEIMAAAARYRSLESLLEAGNELLDIKAGIVGLPLRQQSLRACLEWSYANLSESARLLFVQLGMFETVFAEDDVYEVCTATEIADGLAELRRKSLLVSSDVREPRPYRLLVPVREYALSHLGVPTERLRQRFIAVFTRRACALYDVCYSQGAEKEAVQGIRADLENFRSAWNMACQDGSTQIIADLGVAMTSFAPLLPRAANIEDWLDTTERALQQLEDTYRLGRIANTRARLASIRGAYAEASTHQRRVLDCLEAIGSPTEVADAHSTLALFALRAADFDSAAEQARLGRELSQRCGNGKAEALALCVQANLQVSSHLDQAEESAQQSLRLFEQTEEPVGKVHAYLALAKISECREDLAAAEHYYRTALRLCWELQSFLYMARCAEFAARFYGRSGHTEIADPLLAAVAQVQKTQGMLETARLALPEGKQALLDEPIILEDAVQSVLLATPMFP
jgi:predicted ATPase/class 3 adenylate cyclase